MKQATIMKIGEQILAKYDLDDWSICFDSPSYKRLAQMRSIEREIGLTWAYWRGKPDKEDWRCELRGSILHEVAHALVGAGKGHNEIWRDQFISLLEEWLTPREVFGQVICCSDISADWIEDVFVPAYTPKLPPDSRWMGRMRGSSYKETAQKEKQ